jgi:type VI secretion system protein
MLAKDRTIEDGPLAVDSLDGSWVLSPSFHPSILYRSFFYPSQAKRAMGVFDVLHGAVADGQGFGAVAPEERRVLSVARALVRLFNTRQGTLAHRPDYGLPDLSSVYRNVPESISGLQQAIRAAVDAFEPRLRDVRVALQDDGLRETGELRLVFLLSGRLVGYGPVRLRTTFRPERGPSVRPWLR